MTDSEVFFVKMAKEGVISVSDDGEVFNCKTQRTIGAVGSGGYPKISMKDMETGKIKHIQIHRLLWIIKNGEIPDKLFVNHKDGVKTNNHIDNLELVTQSENQLHAFKLGLLYTKRGCANANSPFTEEDVRNIRTTYATNKLTQRELAKLFNVSRDSIAGIVSRKRYQNVI